MSIQLLKIIAHPGNRVNNRAERTPGEAAVSREDGRPVAMPASPCSRHKNKRTKVQQMSRRAAWLRGAGGYVHIGQYYKASTDATIEYDTDTLEKRLKGCSHTWVRETRGSAFRWRGVGCGERDICPACGSYQSWVLSREAIESMTAAITGVEVGGGTVDTYGIKLTLTIAKTESERIDGLLRSDVNAWLRECNSLYKMGYAYVNRWFGDGCGAVAALQYAGESSPADPHYHLHIYVFPSRLVGDTWESLGSWREPETIAAMRADWCKAQNKAFGLSLPDADFEFGYLGKAGMFKGWLQYLYSHVLADLWRGWQGVEDGEVVYRLKKRAAEIRLSGEDLTSMCERLPVRMRNNERVSVGLIPAHFKRIRWFGIFSDGQRGKTMQKLGLEAVQLDADDDGESVKWESSGTIARFVRFADDGVILREVLKDEFGENAREQVMSDDGWPSWRDVLGDEFFVPDKHVNYSPSKVSIGRRVKWREPKLQKWLDGFHPSGSTNSCGEGHD